MNSNYKFRLLGEADLNIIHGYLNSLSNCESSTDNSVYYNPMIALELFSEVNIRYQLYNFKGEFIVAELDGKICEIIGFLASNSYNSAVMSVSVIAGNIDKNCLADMFHYATLNLYSKTISPPSKLRIALPEKSEMIDELEQIGFRFEYESRDELGWNEPVFIYSKFI